MKSLLINFIYRNINNLKITLILHNEEREKMLRKLTKKWVAEILIIVLTKHF